MTSKSFVENKPFTILTESWFISDRIKRAILRFGGKILGRKIHWPVAVFDSLVRWLEDLKAEWQNITYNINPPRDKMHETVIVLMLSDTLRYALDLKKKWIIKYIYAWPAISVPLDKNDIFFDEGIDKIIIPSQRVADYFVSINPESKDRLLIRPAGVKSENISDINKKKWTKSHKLLVYKKTCPEELFVYIIDKLKEQNIPYELIEYGKFTFDIYMKQLDNCAGMIYLQESESQWLALQEAWIKNIPTLIWNRWFWQYQTAYREDSKISAPYMTADCWLFFGGKEDFDDKLSEFISNIYDYKPREYCSKELTDEATTKLLLDQINK